MYTKITMRWSTNLQALPSWTTQLILEQIKHHILIPRKLQMQGQPVRDIDSHKFQKVAIAMDCSRTDTIVTFYNNLHHDAGSFNILLLPLESIISTTGICALNRAACLGYENMKYTMTTGIYLELTSNTYFNSFPYAMAYLNAASSNSNGFQLIYHILEIVYQDYAKQKAVSTSASLHHHTPMC